MNRDEDQLKAALRREEAPPGFTERVLARVAAQRSYPPNPSRWLNIFAAPVLRWASAVALSAALILEGMHYRKVQRERAEGEAAKQQLMLALRIAGSKLQLAKAKVNEINENEIHGNEEKNRQVKE